MSWFQRGWPSSLVVSLLAAFTTWVTLFAWRGLVESPSHYLVPAVSVCLLVAVSGMLLRSARVPSLVVVMGQVALLVLWATRMWARDTLLWGLVPSPGSMTEIAARIQAGAAAAQAYSAPVSDEVPAIMVLLVTGVAGIAVLVDFLACGLGRAPLAGLPLLAVYTVPVSILGDGVPGLVFVASTLSFLALIAADESLRLTRWGRQISDPGPFFESSQVPVSTQAIRSSARKIGFTATGLALVLPIFVPTFETTLFGGPGGGDGDGESVAITNPMADLQRDLVRGEDNDLVWVTTDAPDPSYLRISVLDSFDGRTWKPSGRDIPPEQRADGDIPRPAGLGADVAAEDLAYSYEISDDLRSIWLPTPYPVSSLDIDGDWRYDTTTLDFISADDGQTTRSIDYSLRALDVQPTAEELATSGPIDEDILRPYTALPRGASDVVQDLTRRLTEDAPNRFEKAVALQDWFRRDGGFVYSLERDAGNGLNDLEQFLGEGPGSRIGYCEQFAAAMAVMGRSIGIPSRVVVGFLRPEDVDDETYVYSAHDLHAWPEMYFEGVGWTRFEPTPGARATSVPSYTEDQQPEDEPSVPVPSNDPLQNQDRPDQGLEDQVATDTTGGGSGGAFRQALPWVVSLLVLALLGVAPRLARAWVRRRRWSRATTPVNAAEAAWSELRDSAIDLRVPWDDSVTLRTRARGLVSSFGEPTSGDDEERPTRALAVGAQANPEANQALERLVRFVERARYARSVDPVAGVEDDVDLCVTTLRDGASMKRRLLATWLPVSLAGDLDGWLRDRAARRDNLPADPGVDHAI